MRKNLVTGALLLCLLATTHNTRAHDSVKNHIGFKGGINMFC